MTPSHMEEEKKRKEEEEEIRVKKEKDEQKIFNFIYKILHYRINKGFDHSYYE